MKFAELEQKVFELAEKAKWEIDRTDVGMTISLAMDNKQIDDLAAMLEFLSQHNSPSAIMANVMHDLAGLKAVYLKDPTGNCFSPRSHNYATKHPL